METTFIQITCTTIDNIVILVGLDKMGRVWTKGMHPDHPESKWKPDTMKVA